MREVREIHTDSGGGLGSGMIVGILLVVVVLAVAAFMYYGGAFRSSATPAEPSNPTNIQINPPGGPSRVDGNVPQAPAPRLDVNVPQAPAPRVDVNVPQAPAPSKP